ncbi:MAG: nitronate monooxygenase [Clostridiales bacterium]|nr:nitronate monooxygenase [Clostridiales bacterium]
MKSVPIGKKGLDIPIIQGGMGIGVSLGRLAGSVALCGGMGVISAANPGFNQPDFYKNRRQANCRALKNEILKAREIARGRGMVAVNVMVALSDSEELVKTAVKAGADAVIAGAGLPLNLPRHTLGTETAAAPIVSSAKAASLVCRSWKRNYDVYPDFVVVEGGEAGGHLGFSFDQLLSGRQKTLDRIVAETVGALKSFEVEIGRAIPVFAAGGIFDYGDIKKALACGAAGAQLGTRFIATDECDASFEFKQAIIRAKKEQITVIKSPVGMPGRALKSPLIEQLSLSGGIPAKNCVGCLKTCSPASTPYCITEALISAVLGDWENGLFFCGENAYRVDRMMSVKQLINELTR